MSFALDIPTTLVYDVCKDLLKTAEQVLIDNNLELPEHRFVSWHQPAWDCCNHLVTHCPAIRPARATRRTRSSARSDVGGLSMHEADFVITHVGCAAVGDPLPRDEDMDFNSEFMYTYGYTLYQGLICHWGAGALVPAFGEGCKITKVSALSPHPPIGGCESYTITFTAQLS